MVKTVVIADRAQKDLRKVPSHVVTKLKAWIENIENEGLEETRKIKGFHDKPLRGKRKGQRSIRLSRAYRAIYKIKKQAIEFVYIEEVNKHEY